MSFRNSIIRGSLAELQVPAGRTVCVVSLGANLASAAGGPQHTVLQALRSLTTLSDSVLITSSLWQTAPLECPEGSPLFINAVAAFVPVLAQPHALLQALQMLEAEAGRRRDGERNAARTLDLDLLLFGDEVTESATLVLPHPRMVLRRFVLAPLAELAPDLRIPGHATTVTELLRALPGQGDIVRMNLEPGAVVL